MIVYNVTVKINPDIKEEWVSWMRSKHLPDMMATGCFLNYRFKKLLIEEEDGLTYASQFVLKDSSALEKYQSNYAKKLQLEHQEKFREKYVAFRTLMELIEEG